jgi:hypothetical protein
MADELFIDWWAKNMHFEFPDFTKLSVRKIEGLMAFMNEFGVEDQYKHYINEKIVWLIVIGDHNFMYIDRNYNVDEIKWEKNEDDIDIIFNRPDPNIVEDLKKAILFVLNRFNECPVCLVKLMIPKYKHTCGHQFHEECLQLDNCPCCIKVIEKCSYCQTKLGNLLKPEQFCEICNQNYHVSCIDHPH